MCAHEENISVIFDGKTQESHVKYTVYCETKIRWTKKIYILFFLRSPIWRTILESRLSLRKRKRDRIRERTRQITQRRSTFSVVFSVSKSKCRKTSRDLLFLLVAGAITTPYIGINQLKHRNKKKKINYLSTSRK